MAASPPPANDNNKRKKGFFSSVVQEVESIVKEVLQDFADMTPPKEQDVLDKKHDGNAPSTSGNFNPPGLSGLAVIETEEPIGLNEKGKTKPSDIAFKGNPWELLSVAGKMRIGCGYIASESSDILDYAARLKNEENQPYTLGLVVAPPSVWEGAWEVLESEPRMFGATGYGPHILINDLQTLDDNLTALLNENPKLVAIGLLGLDEPYAPYNLQAQQAQLKLQLELAADFGIPAYIGHRRSLPALAQTLREVSVLPSLIWANPLQEQAELELVLQYNMYVLVRPELTHATPAGHVYRELVAKVYPDRHLLCSGSTLAGPAGQEGERNSLSGLDASLKALAELTGEHIRDVMLRTNHNAQGLFYSHPQ